MECPFCGKEMEDGRFIDRMPGIVWLPKDAKNQLIISTISVEEAGGLVLCDEIKLGRRSLTARICRSCGKGVFDLSQGY